MSEHHTKFSYLNKDSFMGFAHRGASDLSKENTLDAFSVAYQLGFKNFELDVRASADSQVFVCHDDNLERMVGEPLSLSKLSSNEIVSLERTHNYKIPTLNSLLEEFPDVRLNIDAKSWKVVTPLCNLINWTNSHDRICIGGFNDLRIRSIVRRLGPSVCYSLGPAGVIYCYLGFVLNKKIKFNAGCIQIPEKVSGYKFVSKKFIEFIHKIGLLVHVWTINNESKMRELIEFGVDGIMTDNCIALKKVMKEYHLWKF